MADVRIANASPLIALANVDRLSILSEGGARVLLPEAVVREVMAGRGDDPARMALVEGWGEVVEVEAVPPTVIEWGLGAGESAVIALALQHASSEAVLDDAQARRCASVHGLKVIGTLGLVVRAALRGSFPEAGPIIRDLRAAGLHLDDKLVRDVLDRVLGERWDP